VLGQTPHLQHPPGVVAEGGDVLRPDELRGGGCNRRSDGTGEQLVPFELAHEQEPSTEQKDEMRRPEERAAFLTPSGHEPLSAIHGECECKMLSNAQRSRAWIRPDLRRDPQRAPAGGRARAPRRRWEWAASPSAPSRRPHRAADRSPPDARAP